jgi:peroxygenase
MATLPAMDGFKPEQKGLPFEIATPLVPITELRKPFVQPDGFRLRYRTCGVAADAFKGTARVNIAPSVEAPMAPKKITRREHINMRRYVFPTRQFGPPIHEMQVLQQRCDFFDSNKDGVIWPMDPYRGFHALGFNIFLSFLAMIIIHSGFSYLSLPRDHFLPDPFFRVYTARIHKCKHVSDTGTFDREGRYVPQHFEDIFAKYAGSEGDAKDGLTLGEVFDMWRGQSNPVDPFGWSAEASECKSALLPLILISPRRLGC